MPDLPEPMTQLQLLDDFAREWDALMDVIASVEPEALLIRTDAAGWNARDHLANLSAWLQSVIVMIRDGQPQWTGLGISEDLFNSDDYDPMNEAIRQRTIDWSVNEVLAELRQRHEEMNATVSGMSDGDLLKPVNDFVVGAGAFAICYKIDGNGPYHYREHRGWIETLLSANPE